MTDSRMHALLPPLRRRGGLGWGALLISLATRRNPLPTSPCRQGEELGGASHVPHVLPPLRSRGGLGWGALSIFPATRRYPLPTSPCRQGEESVEMSDD